jgi:RNA polymerase sigma-70 factor (ECF subfamily)
MRSELGNYNSIEALCIRITRNLCLDHLRRRKVNLDAMKAEQLKQNSFPETPSENLEKRENAELVHRLISALPEPQRSLVHLRHLEGKEYEEIAEMVNMNVNAIRVSISRARKQMREMIEKQYSSWRV